MSFNTVTLMGRLTRDPELRYTASNKAVCNISIAVNRRMKRDEADFFDITLWEKAAEVVNDHFRKGQQILVSGELRQETWQDREGNKRSKVIVSANTFAFCGDKSGRSSSQQDTRQSNARQDQHAPIPEDDIPF